MRWLVLIALWCNIATAQVVVQHNISDDGYARVPLQFAFPFYGRVFTESYMFSNGVVGFLNPQNNWCCQGFDLRTNNGTPFSFAILSLQTDLVNYGQGRFLTEGTPQYQRYAWENISEYGVPQNLNTFGVEIRPDGYIGMHYEKVNISPWRTVTRGMTGDVGQYEQFYHGSGYSSNTLVIDSVASTGNLCLSNPLSDPSCAGYQEAYTSQQCAISPLYSPQCVGYEQAYLSQQCSLNALYSPSCQGYEAAYFNQQCSINALFNNRCQGYAQAYLNQQCSINPLYDRTCVGYEAAYFNQQCGLNPLYNSGCAGYETAYFNYQCTQNPLYNSRCVGYEQAYLTQQCNISQLYSNQCSGYQDAYYAQQCALNGLYDRQCPNYAEAYSLANIVTPSKPVPSLQVTTTGAISVETPIVADATVNEIITKPSQMTSQISVVSTQQLQSVPTEKPKETVKAETKQEAKPEVKQAPKQQVKVANIEVPTIATPVVKIEQVQIVDLLSKKMISKPIKRSDRDFYLMMVGTHKLHEEMVDGQYGR